ncbi:hypothetical protein K0M31_000439 [Melipona bicolor]|uniref:Uncharacterized protein n=1 Tax=Melipona bicolor TaxID=60889 RepID=A0AA40GDI2_9HYME|nr:hypothetical protein K0M31_000439 [Melipona bicolor]
MPSLGRGSGKRDAKKGGDRDEESPSAKRMARERKNGVRERILRWSGPWPVDQGGKPRRKTKEEPKKGRRPERRINLVKRESP